MLNVFLCKLMMITKVEMRDFLAVMSQVCHHLF